MTSPSSVTSRFTIWPETCDSRRWVGLGKEGQEGGGQAEEEEAEKEQAENEENEEEEA